MKDALGGVQTVLVLGGASELALATVRNAAPFPPPPILKDGADAYTIRIDFR